MTATRRYRVIGPYITVKTRQATAAHLNGWGVGVQGYSRGAVLPEDVPAETIAHLLRSRLIEAVPDSP